MLPLLKLIVAASVITGSSWLAGRNPKLAGWIIALPISSMIALLFTQAEHRDTAKSVEFAKSFGAEWGVIGDEESDLMGKFGVYSMPATFIVDRQGVIRHYDTGFKPEEQLEKLRNAVKSVL